MKLNPDSTKPFGLADIVVPGAPPLPPPNPESLFPTEQVSLWARVAQAEKRAEEWRSAFLGLVFLVLLVILSQWVHRNDMPESHDAIPSQAWSFGEPGE
jgi:hypothetical protein